MAVNSLVYGYVTQEESYPDGAVIIEEESRGNWVYVIIEGRARVKKRTSKGMVTMGTLKEGDIFGEMVFLEGGKGTRSASVIADGKVRVGILDIEQLTKHYESISPQLKALIKSLVRKAKETTSRISSMIVASS